MWACGQLNQSVQRVVVDCVIHPGAWWFFWSPLLAKYYIALSSVNFTYNNPSCPAPCRLFQKENPFERTILYAISLGGDTDTIATMAGAMAGAFYRLEKVPTHWREICEGVTDATEHATQLHAMCCNSSVADQWSEIPHPTSTWPSPCHWIVCQLLYRYAMVIKTYLCSPGLSPLHDNPSSWRRRVLMMVPSLVPWRIHPSVDDLGF